MNVVCVDTQILIWGFKEEAIEGQEDKIQEAKFLIKTYQKNGNKIIVPALVLSELLCRVPEPQIYTSTERFTKCFHVIPFDVKASLEFAKIFKEQSKQRHKELGISRQHFKIDQMIVATAIAANADCIYSEDKALKKFGSDYIEIRKLPDFDKRTQVDWMI